MDALQDAVIQSMPRGHLNGDDFHLQVSVVQKAAKTTNITRLLQLSRCALRLTQGQPCMLPQLPLAQGAK